MVRLLQCQQNRLASCGVADAVDLHCHCLPGLDDGPRTMDEAIALCRALAGDGITAAIATPHQLGRYDLANPASKIRAAVVALRDALAEAYVPLSVWPGGDVRVDERLLRLLDEDQVMTLADAGRHVLLELPHEGLIDPLALLRALSARGVTPIVSHPERNAAVCRKPRLVIPWLDNGALLQVTAGSLLGDFGAPAQKVGWDLLASGAATLVATDAHGASVRPPRLTRALAEIEKRLGADKAAEVCLFEPLRMLPGRESAAPGQNAIRVETHRRHARGIA